MILIIVALIIFIILIALVLFLMSNRKGNNSFANLDMLTLQSQNLRSAQESLQNQLNSCNTAKTRLDADIVELNKSNSANLTEATQKEKKNIDRLDELNKSYERYFQNFFNSNGSIADEMIRLNLYTKPPCFGTNYNCTFAIFISAATDLSDALGEYIVKLNLDLSNVETQLKACQSSLTTLQNELAALKLTERGYLNRIQAANTLFDNISNQENSLVPIRNKISENVDEIKTLLANLSITF